MEDDISKEIENYSPFLNINSKEFSSVSEIEEKVLHEEEIFELEQADDNIERFSWDEKTENISFDRFEPENEEFIGNTFRNIFSLAKNKLIRNPSSFLSRDKNVIATKKNQSLIVKSGLPLVNIISAIGKTMDFSFIKLSLLNYNKTNPANQYQIDTSGQPAIDSVLTEAIHQFQIDHFINDKEHDGIIGVSTLETLGFFNHGLTANLNSSGFYGQHQLNRNDIKPYIPQATDNEFTAENWYQFILKPAWLGVKISDGIHLVLYKKLREVENWLLSQPQYRGLTPAALGKSLGFDSTTRYSGARLSAAKQAMHGFGLAIDIDVKGNPWIGAGWVQNEPKLLLERKKFIEDLRKASGKNLSGDTIFAYLHSIVETSGTNTKACFEILQQRNLEFKAYLFKNPDALSYWKNSATFGNRNPLNGFLNMHGDLVYAIRQIAGLAWGAIDFGPRASGDIMHFDLRTIGIGRFLCEKIKGFVPNKNHPALEEEIMNNEWEFDNESHEAIEEANWENVLEIS